MPLHLGTRKGLFTLARKNGAWEIVGTAFLGDHIPMLLPDVADDTLYAAAELGHFGTKLHRSEDGGVSWDEIATPAYPEKPEDTPDIMSPMGDGPIPWSLEKIWALEAAGKEHAGALWCGTIPGGLFRSGDRGQNWELVRSLWDLPERAQWFGGGYDFPGIHSICVDPRDSDRIALGISCGGVWITEDDGATWAQKAHGMVADFMPPDQADNPNIQDPHRVVQCRGAPDHFWAQHHNGIFRSTDNSESWQRVRNENPADFGFGVAVHPGDPETAWFVPGINDEKRIPVDGRLVVTRTRDGGKSFEQLRNGLPQEHAYDLVLRHALEIDPTGEILAFGSTTGSLWISEDQGDHWTCVTTHLPPIYCVRFG